MGQGAHENHSASHISRTYLKEFFRCWSHLVVAFKGQLEGRALRITSCAFGKVTEVWYSALQLCLLWGSYSPGLWALTLSSAGVPLGLPEQLGAGVHPCFTSFWSQDVSGACTQTQEVRGAPHIHPSQGPTKRLMFAEGRLLSHLLCELLSFPVLYFLFSQCISPLAPCIQASYTSYSLGGSLPPLMCVWKLMELWKSTSWLTQNTMKQPRSHTTSKSA